MTKEAVKQEVEKLLKAESLCPEGQEAVKAYLKAFGTAEEKSKAEALVKELKEDICGIDDLISRYRPWEANLRRRRSEENLEGGKGSEGKGRGYLSLCRLPGSKSYFGK